MIEAIKSHIRWCGRVAAVVAAHPVLLDVLCGKEDRIEQPSFPMPGPLS